jgi:hypothetical protein
VGRRFKPARDHNKKYCQATVIQLFGNFFFPQVHAIPQKNNKVFILLID